MAKLKKICRKCQQLFYKNIKLSDKQWKATKYCSRKCSSEARKIHKDSRTRLEVWRRKNGALEQGTPEFKERISQMTRLAMKRPEVQGKIRQPKGAMSLEQRMGISNKLMPKNIVLLFFLTLSYSFIYIYKLLSPSIKSQHTS